MTILVLDEHAVRLGRYASWLADSGEPLAGFTGTPPSYYHSHPEYHDIHFVEGYTCSAALELAVLRLAATTDVTGIVATGFADQLRAAALREFLAIPGQHRAAALAATDLVIQRERLALAGIPVVQGRPVDRPGELCRHAHAIGFPIRLRGRRAVGWPTVARIDKQDQLLAFLTDRRSGRRDLLVEPDMPGERIRILTPPVSGVPAAAGSPRPPIPVRGGATPVRSDGSERQLRRRWPIPRDCLG